MVRPFAVFPDNRSRSLDVVGEHVTVLASHALTQGYELFLQEGPEGSGPVPHTHPWDESFYVIRGEIQFAIEEQEMTAVPGTLVHVPAGTAHWFRFGKAGGQMLSVTGAGSRASSMFADIDAVGSRDVEQLRDACERNGLRLL